MLLDVLSTTSVLRPVLAILIVSLIVRVIRNKYGYGIDSIPGPFLASCSDLWRLYVVSRRHPHTVHQRLHRKYGELVRLGPNCVSVSDPEVIKTVYGINAGFNKSDFYIVQQPITKDGTSLEGIFSTTNEKYHAKLRKAVSSAYAMSTLVQFEPFVDSTTTVFLRELSNRFADRTGEAGICDFGTWLQYYAFDVIGELTYSRRLGFVEQGVDVSNIIHDNEKMLDYVSIVGQMPFLHWVFLKNPIRVLLSRLGLFDSSVPAVAFAKRCIDDRLHPRKHTTHTDGDDSATKKRDFLARFIEARQKDPNFMTNDRILALTTANMFAGSDTTAITLRAVFDNLLRKPHCLRRLLQELEEQHNRGNLKRGDGLVDWTEVHDLPYLSAVIKEALRFHPAAGLPLERIVPSGGTTVKGTYIPAGTIVGCSAWTLHQSSAIFGESPDQYRPERWIDVSKDKLAEMNNSLFSFGAGARTCIGRNISMLEMYKLVPAVLKKFELQLVEPAEPLRLHNAWFVKQRGMNRLLMDILYPSEHLTSTEASDAQSTPHKRACSECARKKTKCDMRRPVCSLCKRIGARCEYPQYQRRRTHRVRRSCHSHAESAAPVEEPAQCQYPIQISAQLEQSHLYTPPSMSSGDWLIPSGEIFLNVPSCQSRSLDEVMPNLPQASDSDGGQFGLTNELNGHEDSGHSNSLTFDPFASLNFLGNQDMSDMTDNRNPSATIHPLTPPNCRSGLTSLEISAETADHLLELYFEKVQPMLPLLHRPKILAEFLTRNPSDELRHQDLDFESALLLNSMFALSARFSERGQSRSCDPLLRGEQFAKAAQALYDSRQQDPDEPPLSMRYLQGFILVTFYRMTVRPSYQAWIGIGICSRLAHALSIHEVDRNTEPHQRPTAQDWVDREEKRRAWWIIYEMDNFASYISGRPFSIDSSRADVLLPISDAAWFECHPAPSGFISTKGVATAWRSLVDSGNQDAYAWFLISSYLCRIAQEEADKRHPTPAGLSIVQSAIQCFLLSLPPCLRLSRQGFRSHSFRDANWVGSIHLLIDSAQLTIALAVRKQDLLPQYGESYPRNQHRPSNGFPTTGPRASNSTTLTDLECYGQLSGKNRLHGMRVWSADDVHCVNPFMSVALVAPAAVHFAAGVAAAWEQDGTEEALSELEGAMIEMVLNRIAEYWGIGTFCRDLLQALKASDPMDVIRVLGLKVTWVKNIVLRSNALRSRAGIPACELNCRSLFKPASSSSMFSTPPEWRTCVKRAFREARARALVRNKALGADGRNELAISDDWLTMAEKRRAPYYGLTEGFNASTDSFVSVDQRHLESPRGLLQERGLEDLFSDHVLQVLALCWNRLDSWPDTG
ncbi:hypothetical protein FE257_006734 [Aspergillus nanangensis]|uniref:Zn(2)-C6 fungal-type domain-containing protein n=1 Tax=Aspergillus nanangensis TaxID=2582783 RepID=A0AAD4GTY2_ASPNN|nr:hypothetical protein FE257_006734 [Aspergillus nanangensis]